MLAEVHSCTLCARELEHGVRPVLQFTPQARILVAGQAPGAKVHASGIPFDDASGERLRQWMGINRTTFYDSSKIAILPMGFCYPGKGKFGDLPPIPRCAETWRSDCMAFLPNIELTLAIGTYAQQWHLDRPAKNLTETVRHWQAYDNSNGVIPLPHPSPRNNIWLKKNHWFETDVLPKLLERVQTALT